MSIDDLFRAEMPSEGRSEDSSRPPAGGTPPVTRRGHVAIALTVALLGFLLVTQLHSRQTLGGRLALESETSLAQLLGDLQTKSDQLTAEVVSLRVRLATATGSQEQERVLLQNAQEQLTALKILLGLVPVKGEGIKITITDEGGSVGPDIFVDVVQELRDAGAEAIEVGGIRVVGSTAFTGREGSILVSGRAISSPYAVVAIGSRGTLAEAMRIPGGVVDSIHARRGASVRIAEERSLTITSLRPAPRFAYAERT